MPPAVKAASPYPAVDAVPACAQPRAPEPDPHRPAPGEPRNDPRRGPPRDAPRDPQAAPLPRLLLASTLPWPLAARLAVSLTAQGCHVEAWCPEVHPLTATSVVRRRHRYRPYAALHSLQTAIHRSTPDLIVACDDDAVLHLEQLHRLSSLVTPRGPLSELIRRSLGDPGACAAACDRGTLMTVAAELGLRTPAAADLPDLAAVDRWSATLGYPAVFKCSPSWGGRGVIRVNDAMQARAAFVELSTPRWGAALREQLLRGDSAPLRRQWEGQSPRITAQRFIVGRSANRAVSCWRGQVLAGISVAVLETQQEHGPATVIQIIDPVEMQVTARRLVQHLGLSGYCGLDFVIEAQSGHAYLIEMNPRATPISHLAIGSGRDLTAALVARLLDRPIREAPCVIAAEAGAELIALFPGEWLRNPHSPYLTHAYHDVPWGEPALVEDCTDRPWAARTLLARLRSRLRGGEPVARPFLSSAKQGAR